jgi:hypothetical protein
MNFPLRLTKHYTMKAYEGAGLDDMQKRKFLTLPGLERRPLCPLTRNQSLYRDP